jgi:chromosome segregation ATPase
MVRKVHTREELESMSQAELDKLKRDTEDELDESKGTEASEEKEHAKELEDLNQTTKDLKAELWGNAGDKKQAYHDAQANYTGEGEAVAEIEKEIREETNPIMDLKFEISQIQEDLGMKLMILSDCECKNADEAALLSKKKTLQAELLAVHAEGSAQGPERVRKIETAIEIEKLEREIVTVIRATQDDQKEYDTGVNELQEMQEAMKRNSSMVGTQQVKSDDLLATRAASLAKAKETLERMIADKKQQHADLEKRAEDMKAKVAELEKELAACGCA